MKKLIIVMMLLVSSVCYASTNYDITGTWKGYFNSDAGYTRVALELEQYEDGTITGDWTAEDDYGRVSGKLRGRTLKFTLVSESKTCYGHWKGRGRLSKDGMRIKYTLSGSDRCNGRLRGGGKLDFKVVKV